MSILGLYDKIEVKSTSVVHAGKEKEIVWLNPFVFYFKWDDKNEQIWIWNESKNALHQVVNKMTSDLPKSTVNKAKPSKGSFISVPEEVFATKCPLKQYGNFKGTIVADNYVHHYGEQKSIVWINPHSFFFKWDKVNEQVWIYDDANGDAYLQLGIWDDGVKQIVERIESRVHKREN